jgi:hypothetical protein
MECVSYGVVCDVFYCVDSEKVLNNKDDCQERKLCVELHILIVETCPRRFWNVCLFPLVYMCRYNYYMYFCIYS